jgi:hypothetical protein
MNQMPMEFLQEIEGEFDFDAEIIRQNHLEAQLLAKKGVKVKMPAFRGLMAS